jgi:hypothetical protein
MFSRFSEDESFGKQDALNWDFYATSRARADQKNPNIISRLHVLAQSFECTMGAPDSREYNARLARWSSLREEWLYDALVVGKKAAGLLLEAPSNAYAVAHNNFPVFVLYHKQTGAVLGIHAGRDALVDQLGLIRGSTRKYPSIVDKVVDKLYDRGVYADDLHAFILGATGAEYFPHRWSDPNYGERNRVLAEFILDQWGEEMLVGDPEKGCIDWSRLVRAQLVENGVSSERVASDDVDTASDYNGAWPRWHCDERDRNGKRNLAVIIRRK